MGLDLVVVSNVLRNSDEVDMEQLNICFYIKGESKRNVLGTMIITVGGSEVA
jgi:hypothetical protein